MLSPKHAFGVQPHPPAWHSHVPFAPQKPAVEGSHSAVQKSVYVLESDVPLEIALHKVAALLPLQSQAVRQYLPTPPALPVSPGLPQVLGCCCPASVGHDAEASVPASSMSAAQPVGAQPQPAPVQTHVGPGPQ